MEPKDLTPPELTIVRQAMTSDSKEERSRLLEGHEDAQAYFLEKWNGRKVCGQCRFYTQLGGRGSGYAGVCQELVVTNYLSPEEPGCGLFEKRKSVDGDGQ